MTRGDELLGTAIEVPAASFEVVHADSAKLLTTPNLGASIAITVFDPVARVGGMIHFPLPQPSTRDQTSATWKRPATYATIGLPFLFHKAYELGAKKARLVVCAAGGATMLNDEAGFQIGRRNRTIMRKLFWKNGIRITAEETGGSEARAVHLYLETGRVTVTSRSKEHELWHP